MFLTRWRPFGLSTFGRDLFHDLYEGNNDMAASFSPAVDVVEEDDRFVLKVDLPGVSEKEIEVKVHDGQLIISGKREKATEKKNNGSYYSERRFGSFFRQFNLGRGVETENIEAKFTNGELTVVLPKKEEQKPRQIEIANN